MSKLAIRSFMVACCASVVGLALSSAAYGSSTHALVAQTSKTHLIRAGSSRQPSETSPANQFAMQVNSIGIKGYASSFSGVTPESANSVEVYITGKGTNFVGVVDTMRHHGVNVVFKTAKHSYAQLQSMTRKLAHDDSKLWAKGVHLQGWGPDPASNAVKVTLAAPAKPAASQDDTGSIAAAQAELNQDYGSGWTTVAHSTSSLPRTAAGFTCTRSTDCPEYNAGDSIYLSGISVYCTSGFATTGNKSGTIFILTAGHCGRGNVTVDGDQYPMGSVSTQYFQYGNGDNDDFDTIAPPGGQIGPNAHGFVWKDWNGDYYPVLSTTVDPPVGSYMTVNGSTTGEKTNNYVEYDGACFNITDEHYGTYLLCGAGEAESGSGSAICQPGDSGGPAYVRNSSATEVYAAGVIDGDNTSGKVCIFQEISTVLSTANLSILPAG